MSAEETDVQVEEDEGETETKLYRLSPPDRLIFRDDAEPMVEGRIVPYNEWSEVDSRAEGHFLERFAQGSFAKTLAERAGNARVYFEHGKSRIFDAQPIAELREAWEQSDGVYFRAALLGGLPELFRDGLRRGLYGASIGAEVMKLARVRRPGQSNYNPTGLEERTYKEMRAFDYSITPRPHYASAGVTLRSINDELEELLLGRLLDDPKRLLEVIARKEAQNEEETPEPQHSEPERQEEPVVEASRSTQPSHDYLNPGKGETPWRL
jgi:phage head maturation protease